MPATRPGQDGDDLAMFACPNPDCDLFNHFNAGNLSVCERMGKNKGIRRLYCNHCQHRFSERQGSLMQYTKLPKGAVIRIIKCLGHGCNVEATADICDVDARSVERILERAGKRAADFHRQQLDRLKQPLGAVELDELHGRVCKPPRKKGGHTKKQTPRPRRSKPLPKPRNLAKSRMGGGLLDAVAAWVGTGFTPPWRSHRGF